jgi:hypothetical protein
MRSIVSILVSLFIVSAAWAQAPQPAPIDRPAKPSLLQYSAKFVCGTPQAGSPNEWVAASGRYFTAVNVHNPSTWETASFVKKFALGLPDERVGKISEFFKVTLRPDEVMLIDCGNIWKHLGLPPNTFIEGYAVLQTRYELDVVSVFTAANGPAYEVSTLHTERVPPRRLTSCPGQTANISTGSTPWTLVVDPSGGSVPRSAVTMSPNHPWAGTSGLQFISFVASGVPTAQKTWEYEKCFCTCPDSTPVLNITKAMADDRADILLNNQLLGTITANTTTAATITAINNAAAGKWLSGRNCLRVKVTDTQSVFTGFGLGGTVTNTIPCP